MQVYTHVAGSSLADKRPLWEQIQAYKRIIQQLKRKLRKLLFQNSKEEPTEMVDIPPITTTSMPVSLNTRSRKESSRSTILGVHNVAAPSYTSAIYLAKQTHDSAINA